VKTPDAAMKSIIAAFFIFPDISFSRRTGSRFSAYSVPAVRACSKKPFSCNFVERGANNLQWPPSLILPTI
jgi:hypothetical protein